MELRIVNISHTGCVTPLGINVEENKKAVTKCYKVISLQKID